MNDCLGMLTGDDWAEPIIAERLDALKASHERLRAELRGSRIRCCLQRSAGHHRLLGAYSKWEMADG